MQSSELVATESSGTITSEMSCGSQYLRAGAVGRGWAAAAETLTAAAAAAAAAAVATCRRFGTWRGTRPPRGSAARAPHGASGAHSRVAERRQAGGRLTAGWRGARPLATCARAMTSPATPLSVCGARRRGARRARGRARAPGACPARPTRRPACPVRARGRRAREARAVAP